jgi:hypothetical protein
MTGLDAMQRMFMTSQPKSVVYTCEYNSEVNVYYRYNPWFEHRT